MDLVRVRRGPWSAVRRLWRFREALDFANRPLAHGNVARAGGNGLGQKPVPPGAGVADAVGYRGQPAFEGGAGGVGQNQGKVEEERTPDSQAGV